MREADAVEKLKHHGPRKADLRSRRLSERSHEQAQASGHRKNAAYDHFRDLVGLSPEGCPPFPERCHGDEHREADCRIHRDQPATRVVEQPEIETLIAPGEVRIEDLLIGQQRDCEHRDEDDEVKHANPVVAG